MHELVERMGVEQGRRWNITRERMTVGRSAQCDIRVIDTIVSRRHCEIWESEAGIHFRDLGSSNASLVNGEPTQETLLKEGDEIAIGEHVFVVALAETRNEYLGNAPDEATPITVSLSESRYAVDDPVADEKGAFSLEQRFRTLLAFSRQLSRIESVPDLLAYLEEFLVEQFNPEALWMVSFRGPDKNPLQHRLFGDATSENTPLEAIRRAAGTK